MTKNSLPCILSIVFRIDDGATNTAFRGSCNAWLLWPQANARPWQLEWGSTRSATVV